MPQEFFQNVILTLSDGREVRASVPAFLKAGDPPVNIIGIKVTHPIPLPGGTSFSLFADSPPAEDRKPKMKLCEKEDKGAAEGQG